ncbi:MAG: hypothetical protein WCK35_01855 [Chloroflexota bacterium]
MFCTGIMTWLPQLGIIIILFLELFIPRTSALAQEIGRFEFKQHSGYVHVWLLKAWANNSVLCEIFRQNDNDPTKTDIRAFCGEKIYQQWLSAAPCAEFFSSGITSACTGAFITYKGYYNRRYTSYNELSESTIRLVTYSCKLGVWCSEQPVISFQAYEPLFDQNITAIYINNGNSIFSCTDVDTCDYRVPITTNKGVWIEYWSVSSFGDETKHVTIHLRNLMNGHNGGEYLLDILSKEPSNDYASVTWDVFPTYLKSGESIYQTSIEPSNISTKHHLYYLAGNLIASGQVNASNCSQNGLLSNQYANSCGEQKAYQAGLLAQNQYDQQLIDAEKTNGIPARLVKAIITQESQTWSDIKVKNEYGLGSLTENAIDILLLWDQESFLEVCSVSFSKGYCSGGYSKLSQYEKTLLRGIALKPVGTDKEIDLVTKVVKANVTQVGQIIANLSKNRLAVISTYEDLWDFTIANYHTGNKCIADGIKTLLSQSKQITFNNFCAINNACPAACDYVSKVKSFSETK